MRYCGAILSRSPINDFSWPSATLCLLDGSQVQEDDLAFFAAPLAQAKRIDHRGLPGKNGSGSFVSDGLSSEWPSPILPGCRSMRFT